MATKIVKEIVTDVGGNVSVEYSDDSTAKFNIADTVTAVTNPLTGGLELTAGGARVGEAAHRGYHFHGFAPNSTDEKYFRDIVSASHGSFGANLPIASAWAAAGYVSTLNPATGVTDSVIRIPSVNFDYAGGEKLIFWWLGKVTPEGSDANVMGDGVSTTTPGLRIRAKSTGKVDLVMYGEGGPSLFGPGSSATVFDGSLHSFAMAFDGVDKTFGLWVDEAYEPTFGSARYSFNAGADCDTRTFGTWNIGASNPAPGGTDGIPVATRAFVMMRLGPQEPMPSISDLTRVFLRLRDNPASIIPNGEF